MIEIFATTRLDSSRKFPAEFGKHCRDCRRGDIYLAVGGAEPCDASFFDSPELTLVCRANVISSSGPVGAADLAREYLKAGDDFTKNLRGAFAIVAYDHRQKALKAWTDHLGVERLVYGESRGALSIATDIRLLSAYSLERPAIDSPALMEYLQYTCIPAPRTIYKGISKLGPGQQLTSHPKTRVRVYWDVNYNEDLHASRSESQWSGKTHEAIQSAVSSVISDFGNSNRFGCFLSGGTDSSSVAGLVGQVTSRSPRTFSIGFDDPRYNEIEYARIAAKHFKADHHEYFVKPEDILSLIPKAVAAYDEPFGNSSIVPTYYCARLAADHGLTHLLAGDGGDELFGGNARYVHDRVFQRYAMIPAWMRRAFVEPVASVGAAWTKVGFFRQANSYIKRSNLPLPDRYFSYSLVSSMPARDLFTSDLLTAVQDHDSLTPARQHFQGARATSDLNRWLYMDLKITITDNDLRKVTTMSRLAGVTARYPLLEPSLIEFSAAIPAGLKVRGERLRYLFKKAMQNFLPPQIITKTKHGFGLPYSVWLAENKPLRDFTLDVLGSSRCRQRGYFRSDLVEWLWPQYESVHRGYYGEIFWLMLMLELWHVNQHDNRSFEERELSSSVSQAAR